MKSQCLILFSTLLMPLPALAADSVYCPQKQGYINIGMTAAQVLNACGPPLSKRDTHVQIAEKVPITQLIYTTLNQGAVYPGITSYYNMWSLPSGSNGTSLQVSVMDNKVIAISINGSSTNAMTICGGVSIQKGDDVSNVYNACGNPSLVNNTYINRAVPKDQHPEVWIYQVNQYQPSFSLTFVNGQLQSIQ